MQRPRQSAEQCLSLCAGDDRTTPPHFAVGHCQRRRTAPAEGQQPQRRSRWRREQWDSGRERRDSHSGRDHCFSRSNFISPLSDPAALQRRVITALSVGSALAGSTSGIRRQRPRHDDRAALLRRCYQTIDIMHKICLGCLFGQDDTGDARCTSETGDFTTKPARLTHSLIAAQPAHASVQRGGRTEAQHGVLNCCCWPHGRNRLRCSCCGRGDEP